MDARAASSHLLLQRAGHAIQFASRVVKRSLALQNISSAHHTRRVNVSVCALVTDLITVVHDRMQRYAVPQPVTCCLIETKVGLGAQPVPLNI